MSTGDKRRRQAKRERDAAVYAKALSALPSDAQCANCEHVDNVHTAPMLNCELDGDWSGYAIVKPDGKCPLWKRAIA